MRGGEPPIAIPIIAGLAAVGILATALIRIWEGWNAVAVDYGVFWTSVHRPLLEIYQGRAGAYFAYPPTAILLLKWIELVPFWPGYFLWILLSALAFFLAARRLTNMTTAFVAMFGSASLQNLLNGQTPMLLSAGFLFALGMAPSIAAGMIIGCVAAIKPQLFLMAPLAILVRGNWRTLTGMILGGCGAAALSILAFGFQMWFDWIAALPSFGRAVVEMGVTRYVITPTAIGLFLHLNAVPFWIAGTSVAIFAVLRLSRRVEGANLAALIVVSSIISTPYAMPHDLVGLLPALVSFMLSGPTAVAFTVGTLIYCGLALPILLPAVAFFCALRGGRSWSLRRKLEPPHSDHEIAVRP